MECIYVCTYVGSLFTHVGECGPLALCRFCHLLLCFSVDDVFWGFGGQ